MDLKAEEKGRGDPRETVFDCGGEAEADAPAWVWFGGFSFCSVFLIGEWRTSRFGRGSCKCRKCQALLVSTVFGF